MPLLTTPSISHIDTVYFTSDGTITGNPCRVWYRDWSSRTKHIKTPSYGLDGTPYLTNTGIGLKGPVTLLFEWMPAALYTLIRALANTSTHYATVLYHAQLGTLAIDCEVRDLIAPDDEQWAVGDPVQNVTVQLMSYGAT